MTRVKMGGGRTLCTLHREKDCMARFATGVGMSTFRSFFERMLSFFPEPPPKTVRFVSFGENCNKKQTNLSFFILSNSNFSVNFFFGFFFFFLK